jgi:hypothetical protein
MQSENECQCVVWSWRGRRGPIGSAAGLCGGKGCFGNGPVCSFERVGNQSKRTQRGFRGRKDATETTRSAV